MTDAELKKWSQAIEPRLKTLLQQHLTPKSAPFVQSTILNPTDLDIKVGVYGALAIFEFKVLKCMIYHHFDTEGHELHQQLTPAMKFLHYGSKIPNIHQNSGYLVC
uniref:Uncharacterized protein n=1 Tax=Tanacetum cinerariifolium TaxID=118510 RepID=A0A6L2J982_TANCI|nr:hypothetical protein [Tanacetum cinerariifolium]